ncbi:MAG: type I pullulanase, partial [Bacteroidota bacterium]|nr:type I pullulanase [Bacteroidota bacterium]
MKYLNLTIFIAVVAMLTSFKKVQSSTSYDDYPVYSGHDLGVNYSPLKTVFKVWAPKATEVKLRLYAAGKGGKATTTIE